MTPSDLLEDADRPPIVLPPMADQVVTVAGVSRHFGRPEPVVALERFDLRVHRGELVCLVGASGCGKSTLLNLIAGLDQPTAGTIDTFGKRPALMFQEGALFPWLTALQNVELALKLAGERDRKARRRRAGELLALVQLADAGERRPHQLSGGMRQRVSLARALAQNAEVLLMDEPFGALDAMTRDALHDELERVWRATGVTIIFVTHNVREAVRLADRVVLLASRPGRVIAEFPIDIERPRRIESADVGALAASITSQLRAEVRRHAR